MCFAGQPLPILIFQAFFLFNLRAKLQGFDFLYNCKEFNLKKIMFKTQIYITAKCGQACGTLCAL